MPPPDPATLQQQIELLSQDPRFGPMVQRLQGGGFGPADIAGRVSAEGGQLPAPVGPPRQFGLETEDPLAPGGLPYGRASILQDPRYAADVQRMRRAGFGWKDIEDALNEQQGRPSVTDTRPTRADKYEDVWSRVESRNKKIDKALGSLSKRLDDFLQETPSQKPASSGPIPPGAGVPPGPGSAGGSIQDVAMRQFMQAMTAGAGGGAPPGPAAAPAGFAGAPAPGPQMGPHPGFPGGIQVPPPLGPGGARTPPIAPPGPGTALPGLPGQAGPGAGQPAANPMSELFSNQNLMEFFLRMMAGSGGRQNLLSSIGQAGVGTMQSHFAREATKYDRTTAAAKHRDEMNNKRRELDLRAVKNTNDAEIRKLLIKIDQDNKVLDRELKKLDMRSDTMREIATVREDYAKRLLDASVNVEGLPPEQVAREIETIRAERDQILQQLMDIADLKIKVGGEELPRPKTPAEAKKLGKGARFVDTEGVVRVNP